MVQRQVGGQVGGRAQGVRVLVAEHLAQRGEGLLVGLPGAAPVADGAQDHREVHLGGEGQRVAAAEAPPVGTHPVDGEVGFVTGCVSDACGLGSQKRRSIPGVIPEWRFAVPL